MTESQVSAASARGFLAAWEGLPTRSAIVLNVLVALALGVGLYLYRDHLYAEQAQTQRNRVLQVLQDQALHTTDLLYVQKHLLNQLVARLNALSVLGGDETPANLLRQYQSLLPDVSAVWLEGPDGEIISGDGTVLALTGAIEICLGENSSVNAAEGLYRYAGHADPRCPPVPGYVLSRELLPSPQVQRLWWWLGIRMFEERLILGLRELDIPTQHRFVVDATPGSAIAQQAGLVSQAQADRVVVSLPVPELGLRLEASYASSDVVLSKSDATNLMLAALLSSLLLGAWTVFTILIVRQTRRLHDAEQRYRSSLNHAGFGAWQWDIDSGRIFWSPQVGPIFGLDHSPVEVSWKDFIGVVHPLDRDKLQQAVQLALEGKGSYRIRHRVLLPDGRIRTVEEIGDVERRADGTAQRMFGLVQDLSTLVERDERFGLFDRALNTVDDAVMLLEIPADASQRPRIVFRNDAVGRITGLSEQDLASGVLPDLRITPDAASYAETLDRLRTGESLRREVPYRMTSGGVVWLDVHLQPIRDGDGVVTRCLMIGRDITERREKTLALERQEQRYRVLFDDNPTPILLIEATSGVIASANRAALMQYGYPMGELQGMSFDVLRSKPVDLDARREFEELHRRKDGTCFDAMLSVSDVVIDELPRRIVLVTDITERKHARQKLADAARRTQAILDNVIDAIVTIGSDGRIRTFNEAAVRIFGYRANAVIGQKVNMLMPAAHAAVHDQYIENYERTGARQIIGIGRDLTARHRLGHEFPIHLTVTEVLQEGERTYIGVIRDQTEREAAQERIQRLSYFDELTGLPNRRMLLERLSRAALEARQRHRRAALILIDLDQFKLVNDSHGQAIGDLLLQAVAERLSQQDEAYDTVARMADDEFAILLEAQAGPADEVAEAFNRVVESLLAGLRQEFLLKPEGAAEPIDLRCTASAGVTLLDGQTLSPAELLGEANVALNQAKADGRNTWRFFDVQLQAAAHATAGLISDMRIGLAQGQFHLVFQPQVDQTGRLVGAEALLRWTHPVRGLVSPAEFIPLAEESGLILDLGAWVMERAVMHLAEWARGTPLAGLGLAVNVSARQFRQPGFPDSVRRLLARHGVSPSRLKLELTESVLSDDTEHMMDTMLGLREHGILFSLDDFGTGYSSLSYLRELPLSELKIDKSFVRDVVSNANDAAIVKTIVALGNTLGLEVLAEGVETREQRDYLESVGCKLYQGYLISRPVADAALLEFALAHPLNRSSTPAEPSA